ncbi:MAG TPA: hypothetical protein VEK79_13650 [Thermoanaerobaculia bacterium]|nr:hypothetical protein [Thermoanaerobaculia bacterium]
MRRVLLSLALVTVASAAAAQEATNPIRHTWVVTSCERWTCAAAALIMANGEPNVIALPTGREDRPWLVLRRVEEGSIFIPEDEPFTCEVFESVTEAATKFSTMPSCHGAIVLNVPDGRAVIASTAKCASGERRRSVSH